MATGTDTWNGGAVPLYGDFTITGRPAATDVVTIQQATSGSGRLLTTVLAAGTVTFGVSKNGNPILRAYTTKPTTGLTKNELFALLHNSKPLLALCTSTATSASRLVRLKTRTNGRLTA
jgi:hypothetical protein